MSTEFDSTSVSSRALPLNTLGAIVGATASTSRKPPRRAGPFGAWRRPTRAAPAGSHLGRCRGPCPRATDSARSLRARHVPERPDAEEGCETSPAGRIGREHTVRREVVAEREPDSAALVVGERLELTRKVTRVQELAVVEELGPLPVAVVRQARVGPVLLLDSVAGREAWVGLELLSKRLAGPPGDPLMGGGCRVV